MNRVQIPPSKRAPSNQLPDGTSELRGPTAGVIIFPASSRSRKRSGGLKSKPRGGCRSVAARPQYLVVLRPHRRHAANFHVESAMIGSPPKRLAVILAAPSPPLGDA